MSKRTRKGVKNIERVVNMVKPSHCPKPDCQSTEREPYQPNPIVRLVAGVIDGFEYNQVSWKRTRCKKCGQARTDRIYEKK